MEKFIKENWFKIGIIIVLLILAYAIYHRSVIVINSQIANFVIAAVIAVATGVYACFSIKTWKENKKIAQVSILNSLDQFVKDIIKDGLKSNINPPPEFNTEIKSRLLQKWFPDEHREVYDIGNKILDELER